MKTNNPYLKQIITEISKHALTGRIVLNEAQLEVRKNHAGRFGTFYFIKGTNKLHREDGPAVEAVNGDKEWYIDGKLHREDGPAIEYKHGDKEWYIDGKPHREDGPALEWANGDKYWYINGKLHREDGPAAELATGKYWYINGKKASEEEFNRKMNITP